MHSQCDCTYLASALRAAIDRPFIFFFVHNAVVEANASVVLPYTSHLSAVYSLWEREGREKRVVKDGGWKTSTLPKFQYK